MGKELSLNILEIAKKVKKLEETYPAEQVMMSDGTTSVEEMLNDATYSINGLTFESGVTYVAGGVAKIGNLVIVNLRVSLSASSQSILIHGLPTSNSASNTTIVSVTNNRGADIVISGGGDLGSVAQISAGTLILSTAYITD